MNIFYVYKLIDPRNNTPFYIGKGKGTRAFSHLNKNSKTNNPRKDKKIQEIYSAGLAPVVEMIISDLNEETAYKIEESIILKLGRIDIEENGILTNITIYSQPPSQKGKKRIFSEEHKKKLSIALKGKKKSNPGWNKGLTKESDDRVKRLSENRKKVGNNHQIGMKYSQDRIDKIKNKLKGRSLPEKQKLKMSVAKKGKSWEEIYGKEKAEQMKKTRVGGGKHHNAKKVHTPEGIFNTITEAVAYFKVSDYTVRQRCKSSKEQWKDWYHL
jgi:hypothetical protein